MHDDEVYDDDVDVIDVVDKDVESDIDVYHQFNGNHVTGIRNGNDKRAAVGFFVIVDEEHDYHSVVYVRQFCYWWNRACCAS